MALTRARRGELRAEFETSNAHASSGEPGKVNWSVHTQSKRYINPVHIPQTFGRAPIVYLVIMKLK